MKHQNKIYIFPNCNYTQFNAVFTDMIQVQTQIFYYPYNAQATAACRDCSSVNGLNM